MRMFQVDRLKCKPELVAMLIQGYTLHEIAEFVNQRGEVCSQSSIDRYLKRKLIEGRIYTDGSIEIKEREGHQTRAIRYSSQGGAYIVSSIELS
ncbi:MAG: hypothetical protein E7451_03730 [Ruminococcaceae bacterium]|nr:hypothetical protein [Oscillospiraceae bacterium]